MKKFVSIIGVTFLLLSCNSMAVKYDNLAKGDNLYTRGTSENCRTGWINRFNVKSVRNEVAWGTWEKAIAYDMNFRTLDYKDMSKDGNINLTKVCKSGGCYTLEEEAFADVKFMLVFGYCKKSIHK